jgi:hypothetical protein
MNTIVYDRFIGAMATHNEMTLDKNYYYIDNSEYGHTIRFIFVNEYDYPDNVTSEQMGGSLGFYNSIFSQAQIDWLIGVLQDCIDNAYYAVICMHQCPCVPIINNKPFYQRPFKIHNNKNYVGDILSDIINIYKHGGTLTKTYPTSSHADILPTISVNHSFIGTGKFIAYMHGHSHGDYIGYSSDYSDQLILNGSLSRGLPFTDGSNELTFSDLPRSTDDETQDCYNVYVFDIESSCVHVIRVGSNLTYDMRLRKYAKYQF